MIMLSILTFRTKESFGLVSEGLSHTKPGHNRHCTLGQLPPLFWRIIEFPLTQDINYMCRSVDLRLNIVLNTSRISYPSLLCNSIKFKSIGIGRFTCFLGF